MSSRLRVVDKETARSSGVKLVLPNQEVQFVIALR